jgi:hypothetical protein
MIQNIMQLNSEFINHFDGIISLIAAFCLIPSMLSLYDKVHLNYIENKIFSILLWTCILFLLRFPFLFFNYSKLAGPVYSVAVFLSFYVALYFEALLRKHFPLWFKIYIVFGSIIFLLVVNFEHIMTDQLYLYLFSGFLISLQAIIIALCVLRDKKEYSVVENINIKLSLFGLVVIVPLMISDITTLGLNLPKFGVIGGLIMCYVSMYDQVLTDGLFSPTKKIIKSVFVSIILLIPVYFLIESTDIQVMARFFILFLIIQLAFRIQQSLKNLEDSSDTGRFISAINRADHRNVMRFLLSIKKYYHQVLFQIYNLKNLEKYNTEKIYQFFKKQEIKILSIEQIRLQLQTAVEEQNLENSLVYEQLIDLLETEQMTHLFLLGHKECYVVLLQIPAFQYETLLQSQVSILDRIINGIESKTV